MAKKVLLGLTTALLLAAVTLPIWKPAAKRLKWFVVATNVYQDALRRVHVRSTQIGQPDFGALPASEVPEYLRLINATYQHYRTEGGLTESNLSGRCVLEIGPGETLGVALRLIGAGAEHVTAVDKFVPLQTSSFHQRLYSTLIASVPAAEADRISRAVNLSR